MILLLLIAIHGTSLKTKVSKDRTCFRQNNEERENIPSRKDTNYTCRILVKIQSVFFNNKVNKDNIIYYLQVFLEEWGILKIIAQMPCWVWVLDLKLAKYFRNHIFIIL